MVFTDNTKQLLSLQSLHEFFPLDSGTREKASVPDVATTRIFPEIVPILHRVDKSTKKGLWELVPLTLDLPSQSHSSENPLGGRLGSSLMRRFRKAHKCSMAICKTINVRSVHIKRSTDVLHSVSGLQHADGLPALR